MFRELHMSALRAALLPLPEGRSLVLTVMGSHAPSPIPLAVNSVNILIKG